MEAVKGLFKPKLTPQQQLREWQRKLRQEMRGLERQIRDIQREENAVKKSIKEAAKRGDMGSAKALAKELVRSRKAVTRMHEQKAQLNSISMHLGENVAMSKVVGHIAKSTEVMTLVNGLMKAPHVAMGMQEMSKEMMKAGLIEEMISDSLDDALDSEDLEEETEEEVAKVLEELATETTAQMPTAVRRRAPAAAEAAPETQQRVALPEADEELSSLQDRLGKM